MNRRAAVGSRISEIRHPTPDTRHPELFAIASRDELWLRGVLTESRLTHGQARQSGDVIDASDVRDEHLVRLCNDAIEAARTTIDALSKARVRVVARATREDGTEAVETTMTVSVAGVSVVTTPMDAMNDYERLRALVAMKPVVPLRALPIVWQNGSAAVLLHEAIGHAAEHGRHSVAWPSWLSVEAPLKLRRETFRDVPLSRMTHLIASQRGAPFALPEERIEIHLIAGGAYDPVADLVTIDVAVSNAGPFTIRRTRAEIAASLAGATGHPIRYPGVICSREGQQLYVASQAPVMITDTLL
jgi:BarA-like signal transduction histidine kinase